MGCPSESEIDDVLDRVAPAPVAQRVRRHVAECPRCLERHGAAFELELWGDALRTAIRVAPWWSRARRVAAMAAAVVVALVAVAVRWRGPDMERVAGDVRMEPAIEVAGTVEPEAIFEIVDWVVETARRGPDGVRSTRRSWSIACPERVVLRDTHIDPVGFVIRRERAEQVGSLLRSERLLERTKEER